ncbi:MAG TPA: alkaline phosphatase family protein [Acidimicrobiales bacterium]
MSRDDISRRTVVQGLALGAGLVLTGCEPWPIGPRPRHRRLKEPGDRPNPRQPEGTDLLPEIEHIVIYMQENHSYDSYFGMFHRGDNYRKHHGVPLNSNTDPDGNRVPVFHAPETCQNGPGVSQRWEATHLQINSGRMDGFLYNGNTNAMRYWDDSDIPFYWSLADTFPLCDRWFASAPAQTYPNRLYLQAATCQGLTTTDTGKVLSMPHPAGGTIWEKLDEFGISWADYTWDLPDMALFPKVFGANMDKWLHFTQFLADCQAGTLPQVTIVSPGVAGYTEENPRDIQLGEAYSAAVINAVMGGPLWPKTVLLFMYDEHGGYYDHVPPPAAVPPDDIPPDVVAAPGAPAAWDHYGLRVPAFVISPFAKRNYVSHVVHDHTSVLRLIETKFNLGALTRRDANASNLLDCLDFRGPPAFLEPSQLAAPGLPATGSVCEPQTPPPPTEPAAATAAASALASAAPMPLTDSQDERLKLLDHVAQQLSTAG